VGTAGAKKSAASERRTRLETREDGALRIVAVADTHSHPHPDAAARIAAFHPDVIFHAGDVGDLRVLDDLAAIAPVHAVRGNIDVHAPDLPDVVTFDVCRPGTSDSLLTILMLHVAVHGPKLRKEAALLARARGAGLVVCGHSHVPFLGRDRGIAVMNVGSIGPRRFRLPIVFGVVEVTAAGVALHHVDCETGSRWTPSAAPAP
jgi:putative phosphoesterase